MSVPTDPIRTRPPHLSALVTPRRPDRTLPAIIVLAGIALAGGIALLPSFEEKAEGLLADGRYDEAIDMLVDAESQRPLDGYESYLLFRLYTLVREPDAASTVLAREPALQANTAWALRQLSDLYRETRDLEGETSALRQLYDVAPSDADFFRLRALYRLSGDSAGEASLLVKAISSGQSQPAYIERLAYLQTHSASAGPAAVWAAPTGNFWPTTQATSFDVLAEPDLAHSTLKSFE